MIKIFLIEDEDSIRESLSEHLRRSGHQVIAAPDPTELPFCQGDQCTADSPCCDLMITDQNMPKMTGIEFIRRQVDKGCSLPNQNRLLLTAGISSGEWSKARELGVTVAQKPMPLEDLDRWIRDTLTASG